MMVICTHGCYSSSPCGHVLKETRKELVTYGFLQALGIRVVCWSVLQDLLEEQRVFNQAGARDVQEAPQVQLSAEGGLEATLQEVLHPRILLLLVQQRLGGQLLAAVVLVGIKPRQLWWRHPCLSTLPFSSEELRGRAGLGHDTYPVYNNTADLAHGPVGSGRFGELCQEVFVQRDVGIKVAEDMSEFLLAHNGELQHGVVIRLRVGAEMQRSEKAQIQQPGG